MRGAMRKDRKTGLRAYGPGDGVRRRFHDALDPERFEFPRRGLVHHAEAWYASDAPSRRPVFGVYAFAALAEDLLWRARFGRRRRPDFRDAVEFFAETRRALQNVLSTYRIDRRLTKAQAESLRRVVGRLAGSAKKFLRKVP